MKQWFTAKEIAEHKLPGIPETKSGVIRFAKSKNWESQTSIGIGGESNEYHISNLPTEARNALEAQQIQGMLPRLHESTAAIVKPASTLQADTDLTHRQRSTADARGTVINAVSAMCENGVTKEAAITTLLTQARTGQLEILNPVLDAALRLAKDPRGRSSEAYPSARSIKRWFAKDVKALAPKSKQELKIPTWANAFLLCWQRPEKPSVEHAYRQFVSQYEGQDQLPSIHAVRRFIKKMGSVSRQKGRMGARELKNILPFVRRDFSQLLPADIYSADGHTHDGEVQHPLHGRPFRPEITTFIDIATRRVVGVSVDLAESSIAVLDALISSCTQAVPALIYVDNGGGYANAMLKDTATGVLARLGSTMTHSLPYSSQARGVIERVHQTLWVDAAKSMIGFVGKDMDPEARHDQFKLSRAAIKQDGAMPLMGWESFMAFVNERINWYNARPHSSLPKITDTSGKRRHITPDELWQQHQANGWSPMLLSSDEAAQVFRPRTSRTVNRGEIKFMNNIYFSHDLTEWHREQVHIAYDINDPDAIWVYEPETGTLICKAEWNANKVDYMPKSVMDNAREQRAMGRKRRLEVKLNEVEAELRGRPALEQEDPTYIPGIGAITPDLLSNRMKPIAEEPEPITTSDRSPAEMTTQERIALYQAYQQGLPVPEAHQFWFKKYSSSKEFTAWARREEEMGPEARTL
ncbi:Mu transposase C-terminal domain-containing protein [Amphritea sp. 2_MG-2023]|uniref:Mu transposase C-terminal domain-containing protein n=1 Tax=Amphritea TaxID=515417 RepID=UPI001C07CCA7|nr:MULTISPECIES: Mu transposase C-terminal domain-containing protein [Amphritea]MBU2967088.1 Mu transposase C-terminal domain-containing protein [Amphritea atlantica]MDO6419359.1 Mu transposase C-terminal domain-containing protein [Amphritea sp. 2_MG-2023]